MNSLNLNYLKKVLDEAKAINEKFNCFNTICEEKALEIFEEIKKRKRKGKLTGMALTIKDNICLENVETTAGSAILKGYYPTYSATAVERLLAEGAIPIGKTTMDEFGFGSFGVNVGLGFPIAKNPLDPERTCGGSSSGAACYVKASKFNTIALAESTGGSIANPAAFCGVVGLCPTYGRVSRWGLIDYASSLDKIGVIAKSVAEAALALEIISGYDDRDATASDLPVPKLSKAKPSKNFKIGVIKESIGRGTSQEIVKTFIKGIEIAKNENFEIKEISLTKAMQFGVACYYILAMCEASTNLAKYCGLRYGSSEALEKRHYNQFFSSVRTNYFGKEAKRRIILGTFARMAGYREAYYLRACKVRNLIVEEYAKVFKDVDLIVTPTMPFLAPKFSEIKELKPIQHYMADFLTVPPNLAGLPHISLPFEGIGFMLTANQFEEEKLIGAALALEKIFENAKR